MQKANMCTALGAALPVTDFFPDRDRGKRLGGKLAKLDHGLVDRDAPQSGITRRIEADRPVFEPKEPAMV
jgi:hypothetical protein